MSQKDIEVNAEASFLTVLKLKGGYQGSAKNVSQEFRENSQIYTSYYGGKSNLMKVISFIIIKFSFYDSIFQKIILGKRLG